MSDIKCLLNIMVDSNICIKDQIQSAECEKSCSTFRDYVMLFLFLLFNSHNHLIEETLDVIEKQGYNSLVEKLWGEYFIIRGLQDEVEQCQYLF